MFADLVDLGFEEILKFSKESMTYYPEVEDGEYADLYNNMMHEVQGDTVKYLFRTKFGIQFVGDETV